jgi:methyl-accepting chemotaxis protein
VDPIEAQSFIAAADMLAFMDSSEFYSKPFYDAEKNMLKHMKLSTKLILGFTCVAMMTAVLGGWLLSQLNVINSMLNNMYDNNLVPITDVANANMQALYINRTDYRMIIETDGHELSKLQETRHKFQSRMNEFLSKYRQTQLNPEEEALMRKFDMAWAKFEEEIKPVHELALANKNSDAIKLMAEKGRPAFNAVDDIMSEIVIINQSLSKKAYEDSDVIYARTRLASIIVIIGISLMAVALGVFLTLGITRPLKRAVDAMSEATTQIAAASEQLSSASEELSSGANEQASSIEETSSSLEEMGGMIQNNVVNAQKAKDLAMQVKAISEHGNESMSKLQSSMREILESNEKIEQLVKVIGEIGEKTQVMDEIVFQTKLLSFNASVEAERAGEHGRGFAVVAQEVGNLAQMSGKSAQEIAQIVTSSIRQAESITNENKKKVEIGNNLVAEASKYLKDIMSSAATVTDGAQQVVVASQEQSSGIKQINIAMSNLDKTTQENASMAEETASTSEELAAQTNTLNSLVGDIVRLMDGASALVAVEPPAFHHVNQAAVKPVLKMAHSNQKTVILAPRRGGGSTPKPTTLKRAVPAPLKRAVGSDLSESEEWESQD